MGDKYQSALDYLIDKIEEFVFCSNDIILMKSTKDEIENSRKSLQELIDKNCGRVRNE